MEVKLLSGALGAEITGINLKDSSKEISLKFKKAKSDPNPLPYSIKELDKRPEAKNLVGIYAALSSQSEKQVLKEFGGQGFGVFKPKLADLAVSVLEPINNELKKLLEDRPYLNTVLKEGSNKASNISNKVLSDVYEIIGCVR